MDEKQVATDGVQATQSMLMHIQMLYRDSEPPFWAVAVAWEATRFAWYVVQGDIGTARDKLLLVEEAIADFKRRAHQG